MTEAGWYADPSGDGRMRYWDGSAWTGHVHDPAPPFGTGVGPGGAVAASGRVGFGDLSTWFERLGSILTGHAVPMGVIFIAIPAAATTIVYLVAHVVVGRGSYLIDDERFEGIGIGQLVLLGVLLAVAVVISLATYLAGSHYAASVLAQPERAGLGRSLAVGLVRLPRLLVLGIVLLLGVYLTIGVAVGGTVALALAADGGSLVVVILVGFLLSAAVLLGVLYLAIRLAHLPVAVAVVPRGVSAVAASWRVTHGRFWPVTLRLGILYAANLVISGVSQGVMSIVAPSLLLSGIDIDEFGEVTIGGQDIDGLSTIEFGDVLPNPVGVILTLLVVSAVQGVVNALWAAGTATTYDEVAGPNNLRPVAAATAVNP